MRHTTSFAGAGAVLVFGLLGLRILDLERRVDSLAHAAGSGVPESALSAAVSASAAAMQVEPVPSAAADARLRELEARVRALMSVDHGSPLPSVEPALGADRLRHEEAILSVVEREARRIRDVQLEWHKARWLETRKQQLTTFATQLKLEPAQTAELYQAFEDELDAMAEVMRSPNFADEPDQVASDWQQILAATDKRAQAALRPEQYLWWAQGRFFERKVLWPWLPQER